MVSPRVTHRSHQLKAIYAPEAKSQTRSKQTQRICNQLMLNQAIATGGGSGMSIAVEVERSNGKCPGCNFEGDAPTREGGVQGRRGACQIDSMEGSTTSYRMNKDGYSPFNGDDFEAQHAVLHATRHHILICSGSSFVSRSRSLVFQHPSAWIVRISSDIDWLLKAIVR